jgi:hypothetical protein
MRTNIEIDDTLMAEAQKASGHVTKKQTVEQALRLMIRLSGSRWWVPPLASIVGAAILPEAARDEVPLIVVARHHSDPIVSVRCSALLEALFIQTMFSLRCA